MSEPWKDTTIGECLDAAFSGEWGSDPKPANAIVFRATDIDDEGRIIGSGAARRLPVGKLTAKHLRVGDILLEGSGGGPGKPVGRVAHFSGGAQTDPAVCSNFFKTLRPARGKVDSRFLVRKLQWFYRQPPILALQQQTTGIINLKFEEYLASRISIPFSVFEQRKIAQVLDTLDATIQETEAVIAKLKAVKQGLRHDLLTRGIDANGELRPPQVEAPHLYKQSPLGWIPKEWDAVSIYELASNLDGARVPIRQGSRKAGSFPYYGASGVIDWVDSYLFEGDYVLLGEDGENVISRRLPLAFRATGKIWVNNHAHIFEPKIEVDIRFLVEVMEAKDYGPWISGSAQPKITQEALSWIHFIRPPSVEQSAIGDRLQSVASRVQQEEYALDKLWSSRIGLMDDLLTGRVRVTPLLEK